MKIVCIGGGPGGLYLSTLLKQTRPELEVEVYERNGPDETFGFGVVFSDASLNKIAEDDPQTYQAITANFAHWDDIDVFVHGEQRRSSGHGFSGLSRKRLLQVLLERCKETGVKVFHNHEITDLNALNADLVVGADGLNSQVRERFKEHFQPKIEWGSTRFTWMGTTRQFPAFTFYFKENEHGMWRVHAYNYEDGFSTFIIEATEETWRSAGLDQADEEMSRVYCEALFAEELEGHPLLTNRSIWRKFPIVSVHRWHLLQSDAYPAVVLLGDAVHTAHFSIGSGTKLAIEDASVLAKAVAAHTDDLASALSQYETERKPTVTSLQRAALVSQRWFEETERYFQALDVDDFNFSLLTRSLRVTHSDLKLRDQNYVDQVNQRFATLAFKEAEVTVPDVHWGLTLAKLPPMFTPFRLRDLTLDNRVALAPMCQYSVADGIPNEWTLTHLGSRAIGGNGLLFTEMTAISAHGRITQGCTGIYNDIQEQAWQRIVAFIHQNSSAKIALQLGHAGRKGATKLMWEGIDRPLPNESAWPISSASPLPYYDDSQTPKMLDQDGIDSLIHDYVQATIRADRAGFDMLELHCAHGYLLASFLSPLTNRRDDQFGGSIEARAQVPLQVFKAIRKVWPERKPISVRVSATDWEKDGLSLNEFITLATLLKEVGCDLLNTSTGQTTPHAQPEYGRLFQTPFAERARLEVDIPTIVSGGISSYSDVNSILAAGRADLCLVGRAQLFDPYWVRHAAFEQEVKLPWPQPYGVVGGIYQPRMEWSGQGQVKK
jgi:anthraniloyl-CoA monooxygenase